ncbi:MAG: thioesterase family protein [Negativicutes bacterium]
MAVATLLDVSQYVTPGMSEIVQKTVEKKHTGYSYGGGGAMEDLLATPAYVNLMIHAAIQTVDHRLPKGYITVGRMMEFTHEAPTGTGMSVSIQATVTEVRGNRVILEIIASDELGEIGSGRHERVVVNRDEWAKKVQERLKPLQRMDIK